ncbi:hypothetical protein NA57DRAFT_81097 [Rhizodiscina lignyota]|uniref:Uncharacterized protein n=1 Tax=Rhizodiscina lignyota TaxID=1504668 RepID=A0A9P4M1L4_9PEZI|nr:hypothetical protein NA57DRAFT_81097 [Rhizodiscina lignyota]
MHLLPLMPIMLTAFAVKLPLYPRMDLCEIEVAEVEMVTLDAPTETMLLRGCSYRNTWAAKGKVVAGRTGENFELTADTTRDPGQVRAEYILDGRNIKVGSGDAARAGDAIAKDVADWFPWKVPGTKVEIANNKCNPWTIAGPLPKTELADLGWEPQVTAPMPLEALYYLMKEQVDGKTDNVLVGFGYNDDSLVLVTEKFFQSKPNGIDESTVTDDVLAFCSLVLSYAKAAKDEDTHGVSPKLSLTFMPRTEFNTLYRQIKPKIPGDLWELFRILACYKNMRNGEVKIDGDYCDGSESNPEPNNNFARLKYKNSRVIPHAQVNINDWIHGIGVLSPFPDRLSGYDESIDRSIGGLRARTEKMYNSQRSVPIFEFRSLDPIKTSDIKAFMEKVDKTVQGLHEMFANPPQEQETPGRRRLCDAH